MKKIFMLCLISLYVFTLNSCNIITKENTKQIQNTTISNENSHYPFTITNYNYKKEPIEITFTKAPQKVLAVYQNSIEIMLALGLEENIIKASGLDHEVKPELKTAFDKVDYMSEFAPDKETVIMMQPDFILSWYSLFGEKKLGDVNYWQQNGINTYISLNSGVVENKTLENEYIDILNLGKIFDVESKAESIVNEIKTKVNRVLEYSKTIDTKKRVLIIEPLGNSISSYGKNTLAGDMVIQLGADLISPNGKIGYEDIIKFNPDIIFVVYMDRDNENMASKNVKFIEENKALSSLNAVINKNIYPIALGEMYCSGIRTIDGINTFSKGIYSELQ